MKDIDILRSIFGEEDIDRVPKRQLISVIRRQQERSNTLIEALFKENPNHPLLRNMTGAQRKALFIKRWELG